MNIKIQSVHFTADSKLLEYIGKKISKITTYHDHILRVEVYLKLDNVAHNIKDKIVEIVVHIPRQEFFVKTSSKSFELSFDGAFESMINQIKKRKHREAA